MTASRRDHFEALDALRGVAAGLVLIGHASAVMLGPSRTFVPRKDLAVVFFFTLSGFVVSSAYERRLRAGFPVASFMLRRIIRLFPMIIFGTLVATAVEIAIDPVYWIGGRGPIASALAAVCLPDLVAPLAPGARFPIDPPEWSLFYEMVAYGLFAVVLARSTTRALLVLVALTLPVDVWSRLAFTADHGFPGTQLFEAVPAFTIGVLLWRLRERGLSLPVQSTWLLATALGVTCLLPVRLGVAPDVISFLPLFPLLILSGAARGRAPATRVERALGDLSYPLYIVHWPLLLLAHHEVQPRFGAATAMAVGMAGAVAAAWAASSLYDQPLRRWLVGHLLSRPRAGDQLGLAGSSRPLAPAPIAAGRGPGR